MALTLSAQSKIRTDGLPCLQGKSSDKDGEPLEESLLLLGEQVVAPGDSASQRPVTVGEIVGPGGQQVQRTLQAGEHGLRRQEADTGGGQLDRQGQPVQAAAD